MLLLPRALLTSSAEAQPADATLAVSQASVVVIHTGHIPHSFGNLDGARLGAVVLLPVAPGVPFPDSRVFLAHKLNLRLGIEIVGVTIVAGFAWIR